jgi:O-antigen/teichoic acid export membrane protein
MSSAPKNNIFEKTFFLTLGRIGALMVSFGVPYIMGRALKIEEFGTYKQIMLIFMFSNLILNGGFDWTIHYFIKRKPEQFPYYSLNSVFFQILTVLVAGSALFFFNTDLATYFKNPELALYIPNIVFILFFSIPTNHLDDLLLARDNLKGKILADLLTEAMTAVCLVSGILIAHSLKIGLYGMTIIYGLKFFYLIRYNLQGLKRENLPFFGGLAHFTSQMKFALPVGGSNFLNFILEMDKFLISAFFGMYNFTIYAVGCFKVPIIPGIRSNLWALTDLDMVEAHRQGDMLRIQNLWKEVTKKLALLQWPLGFYFLFHAEELITFIYSEKFAPSAPYFQLFILMFFFSALQSETLFITFGETKKQLKIRIFSLFLTAGLFGFGAYLGGPFCGLAFKMGAMGLIIGIHLSFAYKFLKLELREFLKWGDLIKVFLISFITAVTAELLGQALGLGPFFTLALTFPPFMVLYLGLIWKFGLLTEDERMYFVNKLSRFSPKKGRKGFEVNYEN